MARLSPLTSCVITGLFGLVTGAVCPLANAQEDFTLPPLSKFEASQEPSGRTIQASHTISPVAQPANPFAESFESAYKSIEPSSPVANAEPPTVSILSQPAPTRLPNAPSQGTVQETLKPEADTSARFVEGYPLSDNGFVLPKATQPTDSAVEANPVSTPPDFRGNQPQQTGADFSQAWNADSTGQSVWWRQLVHQPIHSPQSPRGVDSQSLVYDTLRRSPKIRALSQNPLIRELQIVEADADFDPTSFVRSQFQDRNDPIGDSLSITNDGSPSLQEHIWTADAGIRKKARSGGTYELSQNLGFKNSNSSFFTPQDQGTATLALNLSQPLLRGRGEYINQTQILIAQSASGGAWNTFAGELQDEIQSTVDAYWRLYFDRSVYLQKRRNVERGDAILRTLVGRQGLDSLPSQIARARSAVVSRRTDLANALRDIRDSETELRRLTADRNWQMNQSVELIPTEMPVANGAELNLENVVYTALEQRPEIKEVILRSKIAGVQRDISQNDLLPELSLLLGTYVSALRGNSNLGQAVMDQFGEVKPGYSVGFEFEVPFRNRAARSRYSQRQLQLIKIKAELDEVMQNVVAESQISLRRVSSARETLQAAHQAIEAARADLEQNFRRWESFALIEGDIADGQTPTTVLDQLLDSQERLTSAELVYSQSELELKSSEIALLRTMGTLLMHRKVNFSREYNGDMPSMRIDSHAHPVSVEAPAMIVPQQMPIPVQHQPVPQAHPGNHVPVQGFPTSSNVRAHPTVQQNEPIPRTSKVKSFLNSVFK